MRIPRETCHAGGLDWTHPIIPHLSPTVRAKPLSSVTFRNAWSINTHGSPREKLSPTLNQHEDMAYDLPMRNFRIILSSSNIVKESMVVRMRDKRIRCLSDFRHDVAAIPPAVIIDQTHYGVTPTNVIQAIHAINIKRIRPRHSTQQHSYRR